MSVARVRELGPTLRHDLHHAAPKRTPLTIAPDELRSNLLALPAPAMTRAAGGSLPTDLTSFIGRRHERREVRRLLSESRLVTLTGFGGVGKTRLGLRVGADFQRAFRDGVWFAELAPLTSPERLSDVVATAIGLHTQDSQSVIDSLTQYLMPRNALLLLDNCEHLVDACASLVDHLLRACPELHVLTTSREPLGLMGEAIVPVSPLSFPPDDAHAIGNITEYEAITLFLERAKSAMPGFDLNEVNREMVAGVCRQLEGIPLALELAAVRLRGLSPQQLLDRLTDRFALLNSGSRSAPDRQRNLRGCIQWSYELCTPAEREFWTRASVFSGGFELDSAEAVCSSDESDADPLAVLLSLVDKSIVISEDVGGRMRYRLLDVIRQYGAEQLAKAGHEAVVRRRHRDFFADLAARSEFMWATDRQVEWMNRLRRDHANVRAALEYCLAEPGEAETGLRMVARMREQWIALGALGEGRHWFDRLAASSSVSATTRAWGIRTAAWLGVLQGDLAYAGPLIDQGCELASGLDETTRAAFDNLRGMFALYLGDLPQAIAANERALSVLRGSNQVNDELSTLISLQMAHGFIGDPEQSLKHHTKCLELSRRIGDTWFASYSMWLAGVVRWLSGDLQAAVKTLRESLQIKRGLSDDVGLAACVESLAWATASLDPLRSAVLLGIAAARWESMGDRADRMPWFAGWHATCAADLRRAIGGDEFAKALGRGGELDPEEGIHFALDDNARQARPKTPENSHNSLTRREREVAALVARGLSNREIASNLVISQRTAETHVAHIFNKLGFSSRAQIAAWMAEEHS